MTAKEAAIDLIKAQVENGQTLDFIKRGYSGAGGDRYHAQIGMYADGKKYSWDWIIVTRLGKKKVHQAFKIKDIYDEINNGIQLAIL